MSLFELDKVKMTLVVDDYLLTIGSFVSLALIKCRKNQVHMCKSFLVFFFSLNLRLFCCWWWMSDVTQGIRFYLNIRIYFFKNLKIHSYLIWFNFSLRYNLHTVLFIFFCIFTNTCSLVTTAFYNWPLRFLSHFLATTNMFSVSVVLPFPESHRDSKIIQNVAFWC